MLAFLRKRSQSLVIQAIVVVIALVFIFWGVGTNLMNRQEVAITVNDEDISFQQFQRAYDQAYSRLALQFGGTVPKGLVESFNLRQQVINQLIQESLLRQGGREMGLTVSGAEVQKEVETMVQFQDNGRFDMQRYQAILAANRLSPTKYEDSLRHELLGTKTMTAIGSFAATVSDMEMQDLYTLENETVSVDYVTITPDSYLDSVTVTDEALQAWYGTAGEKFKTEAKIRLTYLPFLFADVAEKIAVSDAEVQTYYDQHLAEFQTPEKRHARHILIKVASDAAPEVDTEKRTAIETILEKARNGEDFITLAQQYSEDGSAPAGGDLGFFIRGQMVKPFDDAVFAMKEQEISSIVKTEFGYHIIKLEEIRPATVRSVAEAKTEIVNELRKDQAKSMAFQVAGTVYEQIIGAGSLNAYIEQHPDAAAVKTELFSRTSPPGSMAADPKFLEVAFALKDGELSSLTETAEGYAIIAVNEIQPPQVPPLADVRAAAEQAYRAEQADAAAQTAARDLIGKMGKDAVFADVAAASGFTVQSSGPIKKSGSPDTGAFPQQLIQDAFRLTAASPVVAEPGQVDGKYYVFRFVERRAPTTAMSDEDKVRYRSLMQEFKQRELVDAWLASQQRKASITIHQSLLNNNS